MLKSAIFFLCIIDDEATKEGDAVQWINALCNQAVDLEATWKRFEAIIGQWLSFMNVLKLKT